MALRFHDDQFNNDLLLPDDATPDEVQQAQQQYQQAVQQPLRGLGSLASLATQIYSMPQASPRSTLPGLRGSDVWGMTPEQTNATLNRVQRDNLFREQSIIEQRENMRRSMEVEKARTDQLKLEQQKQKNWEIQQKLAEKQFQLQQDNLAQEQQNDATRNRYYEAQTQATRGEEQRAQEEFKNPREQYGFMNMGDQTIARTERNTGEVDFVTNHELMAQKLMQGQALSAQELQGAYTKDLRDNLQAFLNNQIDLEHEAYLADELAMEQGQLEGPMMTWRQRMERAEQRAVFNTYQLAQAYEQAGLLSPGEWRNYTSMSGEAIAGEPVQTQYGELPTELGIDGIEVPYVDWNDPESIGRKMSKEELVELSQKMPVKWFYDKYGIADYGRFVMSEDGDLIFQSETPAPWSPFAQMGGGEIVVDVEPEDAAGIAAVDKAQGKTGQQEPAGKAQGEKKRVGPPETYPPYFPTEPPSGMGAVGRAGWEGVKRLLEEFVSKKGGGSVSESETNEFLRSIGIDPDALKKQFQRNKELSK